MPRAISSAAQPQSDCALRPVIDAAARRTPRTLLVPSRVHSVHFAHSFVVGPADLDSRQLTQRNGMAREERTDHAQ
jgi:hypothetical protein